MNITANQLLAIMPAAGARAYACLDALNDAMRRFAINTPKRMAAFLAQLAHESTQLTSVRENLNYSAQALLSQFNNSKITRFTPADAEKYGRTATHAANQEMIANIAYANRMGNGPPASGDGWRTRGAGFIQLTGHDNQQACADFFGIKGDIGEWLATPKGAALSSAWFWSTHGCNELADAGDVDGVSDVINLGRRTPKIGDAIGYADRLALTNRANKVLA